MLLVRHSSWCPPLGSSTSLHVRCEWSRLMLSSRSAFTPTALLRQSSMRCIDPLTSDNVSSSSTSAASTMGGSGAARSSQNAEGLNMPPSPPLEAPLCAPEVRFYDTFVRTEVDVHLLLLKEANEKHGVWLNVPPQLAPSGPNCVPPAVPEPLYPEQQQRWLEELTAAAQKLRSTKNELLGDAVVLHDPACLAYKPTHLPPPFATTGTRSLWVPRQPTATKENDSPSAATASRQGAEPAVMAEVETRLESVAIRSPPDPSKLFHCSACGRAFRKRVNAEQHVRRRHSHDADTTDNEASAAQVCDGPGPGEISGYEEKIVACPKSPSKASVAPLAKTSDVANLPSSPSSPPTTASETGTTAPAGPNRSGRLLDASMQYRATPRLGVPAEELVDSLLKEVWDAVGIGREDIEKPSELAKMREQPVMPQPRFHFDSCNGRFFIPSVCFVEGTADNRGELELALAGKPAARATPVGAAPGIKRRPSAAPTGSLSAAASITPQRLQILRRNTNGTIELEGSTGDAAVVAASSLAVAPTAMDMSVAELSRHYPNPFGDSPNAALVELEKEPLNPFRDLEAEAAAMQVEEPVAPTASPDEAETTAKSSAEAGPSTPVSKEKEWASRWAARPFACPICQRRALPTFMRALAPLLPPSLRGAGLGSVAGGVLPSSPAPALSVASSVRGAVEVREESRRCVSQLPNHHSGSETGRSGESSTPSGSLLTGMMTSPDALVGGSVIVDEEAWAWYAQRVPRYRLLDALEDHIASHEDDSVGPDMLPSPLSEVEPHRAEEDEMAAGEFGGSAMLEEDWQRLYYIMQHTEEMAQVEMRAVRQAYRSSFGKQRGGSAFGEVGRQSSSSSDECSSNDTTRRTTEGIAEGQSDGAVGMSEEELADSTSLTGSVSDAAITGDPPHVHVRMAVNTVLVGTVRDVQEGFVGATRVLQYVVGVENPPHAPVTQKETPPAAETNAAASNEISGQDVEEELIVVRCVGDRVPVMLLHQKVRLGSTIFVSGSLRMNRNTDTASRRSHAYPFVQVVPPLGTVVVLGS